MKNLIDCDSQTYPSLYQYIVEKELTRNKFTLGPKTSRDVFIKVYRLFERLSERKQTKGLT